jgi:ceramide glucosyltransferase
LREGEAVTLLKPLHGAEPELEQNLASFCTQDYPAPVEIVCGVESAADPATAIMQRLRENFPDREIKLATASKPAGGNPKIANVLNMLPLSRYKIQILSDSDMRVGPHYVRDVISSLQQPEVGAVTCLYRGHGVSGFWSRLAAAAVDHHFLPGVLVALRFGLAQPCFGSTIALRNETLQRIGGFESVADTLADDYAIGDAVRRLGLKVAVPPFTVLHTFSERSFSDLLAHELRWAHTIRGIDPKGYAASIVTHPLPFAIAAVLLSGFSTISLLILAATLACRVFVPIQIGRLPGERQRSAWLSPLRDLMSFAVFVASFVPAPVDWRGRRYRVGSDGRITPV